jgi:tRNA(adenine34) deaminase
MQDHEHYMRVALTEAEIALDEGEFPVGCVLVGDDRVLAKARRKNSRGKKKNEIDHAEVAALRQLLQSAPETDCSVITAYSTMEPCLMCYSTMLLSGIRRFVWAFEDTMGGGTDLPLDRMKTLYAEIKVELIPHVLRTESLQLFQQFFRLHTYWQDSSLARYTLEQDLEI